MQRRFFDSCLDWPVALREYPVRNDCILAFWIFRRRGGFEDGVYDRTKHACSFCNHHFSRSGESVPGARTARSERLVPPCVVSKFDTARNYSDNGKALDSPLWGLCLQIVFLEHASCGRIRGLVHRNIFLLLVARVAAQEWILAYIPSSPSFTITN